MPKRFARGCVESNKIAFGVTGEHEAARSRKNAGPGRGRVLEAPPDLSGGGIDRLQETAIRFGFFRGKISAAVKCVARLVGLGRGREDVALVARGHVEERSLRIVSRRHEVGSTKRAGANGVARERGRRIFAGDGTSGGVFGIAPGLLAVGVGGNQLSIGAVEDVEKSVAVGLRNEMF